MIKYFAIAAAFLLPHSSQAEEAQTEGTRQEAPQKNVATNTQTTPTIDPLNMECKGGNLTRKIWISYGNQKGEDCKVHYSKPSENAPEKVLWSAKNDPSFCQDKAKAFIEKQEAWNFSCEESAAEDPSDTTTAQ